MATCCNKFIFNEALDTFQMWQGLRGPYFTPHVSEDGDLSWTNNGQLPNPETVNIKGPPGSGGAPGGTTGQLLAKASDEDYDTEWIDPPDLDAGHVEYDPAEAYDDGSVGKELTTINSALSSLSSVAEIIDTASGAIASFPDGAGLPMRSLVAEINPVQDLHGYDAPWAGGAGKNLLPMTLANMKTINYAGTWNGNVYTLAGVTFTINTDDGGNVTSITTNGTSTGTALLRLVNEISYTEATTLNGSPSAGGYNSFKIQAEKVGGGVYQDIGNGINMEANVSLTRIIILAPNGTVLNNTVFYPMVRLQSVSDATFAPYSNECPITGWTGLSGGVFDVNLLNQDGTNTNNGYVHNAYINVYEGAVNTASGTWDVVEYVPVKPNTTYTLSGASANGSNGWAEYDINKVQVAHGTASYSPFTFTTGANTYFVRFNRNYATDTQCQINLGSSALPYVPYTSLPITCTWQTEAGTVYDGYIDVVSGDLVAEVATKTFDGSSDETISQTPLQGYSRFSIVIPDDSITWTDQTAVTGKLWSNEFKESTNIATGNGTIGIHYRVNGSHQIVVGMGNLLPDDLTQFRTWLSNNPLQVVYTLAEPIHYTLTPQQISTLIGNNTVFVDTGNVTVTYQASIKGYIDKVLGA